MFFSDTGLTLNKIISFGKKNVIDEECEVTLTVNSFFIQRLDLNQSKSFSRSFAEENLCHHNTHTSVTNI